MAVGGASAQIEWRPLPEGTVSRVAFGSCAKHWQHQPVWETVVSKKPDLFLYIGDAIYADTDGITAWQVSEKQLAGEWGRLADKAEFQVLAKNVPVMATWDNHDYGTHNGSAEFPLKEASRDIFLDFFGEPAESSRRGRDGVYDAKVFGPPGKRLQIILLDTRYNKGPFVRDERSKEEKSRLNIAGKYAPNDDPEVTLLGNRQWQWLEEQLREPAEVRLVLSSTQIVADEKGMDEWGNYPHERLRLFDLIAETGASGVIFLSGNVHFGEISRVETAAYPLLDFTSSGLTHVNESYARMVNSYRVAGPYVDLNFGLVEIDWAAGPVVVTFKLIDLEGTEVFAHKVPLDSLQNR